MENRNDGMRTIIKEGYCEYAGRKIAVFFYYSDCYLVGKECPRNGCIRLNHCKLYNSMPEILSPYDPTIAT